MEYSSLSVKVSFVQVHGVEGGAVMVVDIGNQLDMTNGTSRRDG